jgi:hypothetical protein
MKKLFIKLLLILPILLIYPEISICQDVKSFTQNGSELMIKDSQKRARIFEPKEGHITSYMVTRDGEDQICDIDLTEEMEIIVEFKEEPLFVQQKRSHNLFKTMSVSSFMARFDRFAHDLANIENKISSSSLNKTMSKSATIKKNFYKTFFGVSLTVTRATLADMQSLSYVKKIHQNKKYKANLNESVPLIRADLVRNIYGTEGDSIVVGIIDTGIDYNHPALGGGFGPGYKVISGYDIINNDADPMDDVGHGTHVAGIVAADGEEIKGVAPKALLMAFKVLAADGWGTEESVIGGIERAVDPDDDGDFSDMVDIANMSLSGAGDPDDALSHAVDNAVELGVVFCIAAGNEGEGGFSTIGSPGTARRAITVGASDKIDNIAFFSSRGPNQKICSIKPEIVAPGVDIYSCVLNGEYEHYSGTSMAAPHVAGVCALLKSIHSDWTPDKIKSALMTSAVDIGEEIMVQGSGRIDALSAAEVTSFARPAHLSFGYNDISQTIWTVHDTVWIYNDADLAQNYHISIWDKKPGMDITATPSSFSISTADSLSIIFTLTVDNNSLPYPQKSPFTCDGSVLVEGNQDTLYLPWSFVRKSTITLTFDMPQPTFYFTNKKLSIDSRDARWIDHYTAELDISEGIYDLLVHFPSGTSDKFVLRENLTVDAAMNLSVNSSEAVHHIEFNTVDEQGRLFSSVLNFNRMYAFIFPDSSAFRASIIHYRDMRKKLYMSDFSDRFQFVSGEVQFDGENIRTVQHRTLFGVDSDVILTNSPDEYLMQYITVLFKPTGSTPKIVPSQVIEIYDKNEILFEKDYRTSMEIECSSVWMGKLFIVSQANEKVRISGKIQAFDGRRSDPWINSKPFGVVNGNIACFSGAVPSPAIYISPEGKNTIFEGVSLYSDAFHANNLGGETNILAWPYFFGALDEEYCEGKLDDEIGINQYEYTIYNDEGCKIAEGPSILGSSIFVDPGRYKFEAIDNEHFVRNLRGKSTLVTTFDLHLEDADPPRLTSWQFRNSEGVPTTKLKHEEPAILRFSAGDFVLDHSGDGSYDYQTIAVDSTRLSFKLSGTEIWQTLDFNLVLEDTGGVAPIGCLFSADLSGLTGSLDSVGIDIKVVVKDQIGNLTEWMLEPGFIIGDLGYTAPSVFSLRKPEDNKTISDAETITFNWKSAVDLDGDLLTYDLMIFNADMDTTIENIYHTNFDFENQNYLPYEDPIRWTVTVSDGITTVASSDTFSFMIGSPSVINELAHLPKEFSLYQNYPNPFNPSTIISFALPKSATVKIKIFDILGREVRTLMNETMQPGIKKVVWDGRNRHGESVPSGMYFYRLEAGVFTDMKKMIIIK